MDFQCLCIGNCIKLACREVLWKERDGQREAIGLRVSRAGREQIVHADAYVAALDVPGAQRLIPAAWRDQIFFDSIYRLQGVPVITVQLRSQLALQAIVYMLRILLRLSA